MRILLVEDDLVLRQTMVRSLIETGHRVDEAADTTLAKQLWLSQPYDAILLDLNLPQDAHPQTRMGNALVLLQENRARGDVTPVIVITARNRIDERIAGLNAGADDYLSKPFDLDELEARLRAVTRRVSGASDSVSIGQLTLDRLNRRFSLSGTPLDLTAREFDVLWELMSPPGKVVSKRLLSSKLSHDDAALGNNALEVFISRLRKKISHSDVQVRTLRGIGYVLETASA